LNPASDAVYVGPSRERTANGRRSSAGPAHGYIARSTKRPGRGHVGSARRPGFPQREPALPTETRLSSRVARGARGRVILLERGLDRSRSCGRRGQAVVRRTVPLRSLDDWARPCVLSISFTGFRSNYDITETSAKTLGCLRPIERNTNILGRSRNWSSNFPADRAGVG